ncbi:hypothetical protein C8F01DRAFT_191522 [Mycena amicta]|nr:hypothetical protein C8F01DRAFT_191522 [Mycena amicta]
MRHLAPSPSTIASLRRPTALSSRDLPIFRQTLTLCPNSTTTRWMAAATAFTPFSRPCEPPLPPQLASKRRLTKTARLQRNVLLRPLPPRSGTTGSRARNSTGSAPRRPTASQTPAASVVPTKRPVLSVRVPASARPTVQAPAPLSGVISANNHTAPGGVKAECSNCGATHTPLWRRGLNDELNCNACGLYCKLHKRPRPKTMRNNGGGEGRGQSVRSESVDVLAQCYNCHTTATPLWRKDDEGKTVCNACGLYYKLHGSARPISMKSDVIRKRSRHDARRSGQGISAISETPTASPGVSRRASPAPGAASSSGSGSGSAGRSSPVLSADTSPDTSASNSAVAPKPSKPRYANPFSFHEAAALTDALPFASIDVSAAMDNTASTSNSISRANKRRRMSVDSASEPPSSATSYNSSYIDHDTDASGYSSQFSSDFPFSRFPNMDMGGYNDGNGNGLNSFWHPPMLPTTEETIPEYHDFHPPMMVQGQGQHGHGQDNSNGPFFSSSGYMQNYGGMHPPMQLQSDMLGMGMGMLHPPMMPYEDDIYDGSGSGMHY